MRGLFSLLTGGVVLVLAAGPSHAITLMVGQADDFAASVEPLGPSAALAAVLVPYGGTNQLDQTLGINGGQGNAQVAHTFKNLPPRIRGAKLEVHLKAGIGETETDGICLSFVDRARSDYRSVVRYARSFGPLEAHPPLHPFDDPGIVSGDLWTEGDVATLTLDLGNLPLAQGGLMSLIQDLNGRRFLDVSVGGGTAVDYMKLDLVVDGVGQGDKVQAALASPDILGASPSPVRGVTNIEFALPAASDVALQVFDDTGRNVASVERAGLAAGRHSVDWDTRDSNGRMVPAGVYFYRVQGAGASATQKMTVVR